MKSNRKLTSSRAALGGLILVGAVAAAGCGSSSTPSSSTSKASASKPVHIAFLNEAVTSYTLPMTQSMTSAAAAHNATIKMFNANSDPSTQLSQCSDATSSGTYQAIILYPVSSAAAVPCVRQAVAAHIPIVPVDTPVGPNPASLAIQVPGIKAQVLGAAFKPDVATTIALVKQACSHFSAPCTIVQTEAIPAYIYSTYKVSHEQPVFKSLGYKILATPVIGNFDDPDGTRAAIETVLAKYNRIDVIVSDDDSSVQGAVLLKKEGKLPKTLIIGDGGNAEAIQEIKRGLEFGTVMDVPRTEAAAALEDAVALVRGQHVPYPNATDQNLEKYYMVTQQDAGYVTPQW